MNLDVIFENATIIDGSGKLPYRADVGTYRDKIKAIGQLDEARAKRRISAKGKILCPGFIDIHTHTDLTIHLPNHHEFLEPLLRQGITTFVGGNCGYCLAPIYGKQRNATFTYLKGIIGQDVKRIVTWKTLGEFLEILEERGVMLNTALLAPHGIIRALVMGTDMRLARVNELDRMARYVRECMEHGAFGMSTGLQYFPGSQSDTGELIHLAKVVREYDGVYTSHLRSYSNTLDLAIEEAMIVAREADIHSQISHLFWIPHVNKWVDEVLRAVMRICSEIYKHVPLPVPLDGAPKAKLEWINKEIEKGLPLGVDGMPTSAGFTFLMAFFPPWVWTDSMEAALARLADPEKRKKIRNDIETGKSIWPHRDQNTWSMNFFNIMGWGCAFIMSVVSQKNKHLEGKNLVEIGKMQGKHPFDVACDLLLDENGNVLVFETPTHPGDDFAERSLYATMADPNVSIATDTILLGYGKPSHLFYDCFPKYISRYARDFRLVSLQEAIRKCTSLPASQIGIAKRGLVKEGYFADLVLFDYEKIGSNSTYDDPANFPSGIEYVLVNGKAVVDPDGYHTDPRPGMVLRKQEQ